MFSKRSRKSVLPLIYRGFTQRRFDHLMKREDGSESNGRDRSAGGSVKSKDCKV